MFCMHTTYHLHLHLWNLLSACHSFPTFVCMQVIKINFFGLGNGVEKWARAKVQIISASFYFTWDLSALIFKLIYIYIYIYVFKFSVRCGSPKTSFISNIKYY